MRVLLFLLVSLFSTASTTSARHSTDDASVGILDTFEGFTLQVAAFNTRAEAEIFAKELPESWVAEALVNGQVYYRVNFGRFASRSQAVAGQWNLEDILANLPAGRLASAGLVVRYKA